jgi:hypothetical protein
LRMLALSVSLSLCCFVLFSLDLLRGGAYIGPGNGSTCGAS